MDGNFDVGGDAAEGARSAVRLAVAMRGQAEARRQAEAARAALAEAEARLADATGEVDGLKAGVTFEDLLELVASLSLRVAELEARGAAPVADHPGSPAGESRSGDMPEDDRAAAFEPAPPHAPAQAQAPQQGDPALPPAGGSPHDDAFGEGDGGEGRRPPDRAPLYMNAYARGFAEVTEGKPDTMSLTRGWEFKGYKQGRKQADAGLEFDPLGAFVEEMSACRIAIEPRVREQARKLAVVLSKEHADRVAGGGRPAQAPAAEAPLDAGWESAGPSGDGAEDGDGDLEIPGFLQRRADAADGAA